MQSRVSSPPADNAVQGPVRLHYLDWLRVLAIIGVFLFHALHPFTGGPWVIKNVQESLPLTVVVFFFFPWGMPFFFMIAGMGSWLALRRRSPRQFARERFQRLLVPFFVGAILFAPIQLYCEWWNRTQLGQTQASFWAYVAGRQPPISPRFFDWAGFHLWFLGFLFAFSLLGLPIFAWLKNTNGMRFTGWLARLCDRRGGILLAILPLLLVQLVFRRFFPAEQDWADFLFRFAFFVVGYILYTDERFSKAMRRDRWLLLAVGAAAFVALAVLSVSGDPAKLMAAPGLPGFYLFWGLFTVNSWCWSLVALHLGMHYLNFSNAWLEYGKEAVLPFFVVHQPVIVVIALFVVQWNAGIGLKALVVVLGSFVISLGVYELVIKRIGFLRVLFGMTAGRSTSAPSRPGETPSARAA